MYGDAPPVIGAIGGRDIFVLAPGRAKARILDFEQGKDRIDLTAFAAEGIHSLSDLHGISPSGNGLAVSIDENTTFRVFGAATLTESDFIFA